jgi:hypothetical protein
MSWNISWEGRATDFAPDLLQTLGKPGRVAQIARDVLWEGVQRAGEQNSEAWVRVSGHGWEQPDNPGLGKMVITVDLIPEPSDVSKQLAAQKPMDLRHGADS